MGTTDRFASGARIGDYVIEHDLGDSYVATHVLLPRRVKLEVMPGSPAFAGSLHLGHPTFVGLRPAAVRMMREACILEAMRHVGVPRVYEVGVLADHRTSRPWIATELVDGVPVAAAGRLSGDEVTTLLRDAGEVLAHAHKCNIVHRNVRPESILRGDGSRGFSLCVINWSSARIYDDVDEAELAMADDVFALGVVAHQALTGHLPNMPTARRCPTASARLCALIDDLLVANPMSRPSAAEVCARAKLLTEISDEGDLIVEERVVLAVDISRDATAPMSSLRTRWTPPHGVTTGGPGIPSGAAIGVLKPRT